MHILFTINVLKSDNNIAFGFRQWRRVFNVGFFYFLGDNDSESYNSDSNTSESEPNGDADLQLRGTASPESQPPITEAPADPTEVLLGSLSKTEDKEGPEIFPDLAVRWQSYLSVGLDKESRKKLLEDWHSPKNCSFLKAPVLNPEVAFLLSPAEIKKDKFLLNIQNLLGKGLSAQGAALSKILEEQDTVDSTTKQALVDSGKLLTDTFHSISVHRKFQLHKSLNDKSQKISIGQNVDTYLFGSDFAQKCKSVKDAEAVARELFKPHSGNKPVPSTSGAKSLNFQRPSFKKRMKSNEKRRGEPYTSYRQSKDLPRESSRKPGYYTKNNNRSRFH